MDDVVIGMLLISIMLLIVFAAILFFGKHQQIKANRFLGIFLFLVGFGMANFVSVKLQMVPVYFHFGYIIILMGPMVLYFYIRVYFRNAYTFKLKHLWHLSPFMIQFILWLIFVMSLPADKGEIYSIEDLSNGNLYVLQGDLFFIAVIFFYLYMSVREIKKYKIKAIEEYSYSNRHITKWLYIFIFSILIIPVIMTAVADAGVFSNAFMVMGIAAILLTTNVILIFLFRPEIYQGIGVLAPIRLKPLRDSSLSFSQDQKAQLFEELTSFIESEKTYLDSGLTLKKLSDTLKTNQNYLSRAINGISGKSFLEFINTYRIKYAKELLSSKSFSKYTIEGIAKASGFRSKSAFYNYFKKYNGMSPVAFVERHKMSANS